MIVYRVQAFIGTDWVSIWTATLTEGRKELANFEGEHEARLDKIDVPPGRNELAAALNLADANHMNFEGELVARTEQLEPTP